jgi:hypothetical protein
MKNHFLVIFTLLICSTASSQIKFEKGYFIDNHDKRTECLIKNEDWYTNPSGFTYKFSDSTNSKVYQISTIKEFGIYNISKYERHNVKIDLSSENIQNLSLKRNPEWVEKTLYLKILVEGEATLYSYRTKSKVRFFYSNKNENIEQLIYKKYRLHSNQIATNLTFVNQLYKNVNCNNDSIEKIQSIKYNSEDLINHFNKHIACSDPSYIKINISKSEKIEFKLKLISGANISSLALRNGELPNYYSVNFGSKQAFRIGFETELILPHNNQRWSLFIEPIYTYYKGNIENEFEFGRITPKPRIGIIKAEADIKIIEISLGGRHYFLLNKHTKLFADAGFTWGNYINSKIKFELIPDSFIHPELEDISAASSFFGGIGILINSKFNVEVRFQTNKNSSITDTDWKSELNTFSFILGYFFN